MIVASMHLSSTVLTSSLVTDPTVQLLIVLHHSLFKNVTFLTTVRFAEWRSSDLQLRSLRVWFSLVRQIRPPKTFPHFDRRWASVWDSVHYLFLIALDRHARVLDIGDNLFRHLLRKRYCIRCARFHCNDLYVLCLLEKVTSQVNAFHSPVLNILCGLFSSLWQFRSSLIPRVLAGLFAVNCDVSVVIATQGTSLTSLMTDTPLKSCPTICARKDSRSSISLSAPH